MDRLQFIKGTVLTAVTFGSSFVQSVYSKRDRLTGDDTFGKQVKDESVIDTNIHLCCYPFRDLKYGKTRLLVEKLKQHNVGQAWAGSFMGLFHKNIAHVNADLTKKCRENGKGMLVPFGTVNPVFPDWEEDLRRCHEVHEMPGIRLYPGYHGYTLGEEKFLQLLRRATERELLVQIAIDIEDERMQHPLVEVPAVDVAPLPEVLAKVPKARVQLINSFRHVRGERLRAMIEETDVFFEISNLDFTGALELILEGNHAYVRGTPMPPDRLLFGSHMPYFPLENSLFKFMESDLTKEQAHLMLRDNAKHLLAMV